MNSKRKIYALSLVFCGLAWGLDSVMDFVLFSNDSFWGLLIADVPAHVMVRRITACIGFVVFGWIIVSMTRRHSNLETQLREVSIRYETILKEIPDIVMEVDNRKVYTWANAAGYAFFGMDVIGKEAAHYFIGDQTTYNHVKPIFNGDESVVYVESWQRRRDGEARLLAWWCRTLKDQSGRVMGAFSTARDITETRRAEEENKNLAKFPEENPNPVLRISSDGVLLYSNKSGQPLLQLWGIEEGQSMPEDWRTIIREIMESSTIRNVEVSCGKQHFLIELVPVFDNRYVNAYGRDVTEMKRLEEQIRQSQKMEAIGRLAGGVAHDFNNLLMAIIGYSELILSHLDRNSSIYGEMEEIKKAGDRAATLTRQLLAFSRKQVLQPEYVKLNDLIFNMDRMIRRLIGEDIELITIPDPRLGIVKVDPGQVEQVIMNLVVNARDAMPHGGNITIESGNVVLDAAYAQDHLDVKSGPYVMLAVSDTGIGMDKEIQKRIFDPFFTTKELGKGTGLGLSTVYGIVKQSGGHIYLYSEPHQGTTFKIYFPCVEEKEAGRLGKPDSLNANVLRGTETILLVEDEKVVRTLILRTLKRCGYTVIEASYGSEALQLFERTQAPIQLLITDVIMPKMSGRELAKQLTALKPELKVLYMSGYTDNAIVHHGILDEGIDFIQKPFTPDAIVRKVREMLDTS
ncbi:MAG: response regulator [Candidatus Omnitrophota bacterium]|jgi:PAS domain S-box-containing protein|nr:MAG: response regulator [Candidatus Omnitrophota bacterium]